MSTVIVETVRRTTYIANDGTEHDSKEAVIEHCRQNEFTRWTLNKISALLDLDSADHEKLEVFLAENRDLFRNAIKYADELEVDIREGYSD